MGLVVLSPRQQWILLLFGESEYCDNKREFMNQDPGQSSNPEWTIRGVCALMQAT